MLKKQKTKTMVAKRYRVKRRIDLSNKRKRNYKSDTRDDTSPD